MRARKQINLDRNLSESLYSLYLQGKHIIATILQKEYIYQKIWNLSGIVDGCIMKLMPQKKTCQPWNLDSLSQYLKDNLIFLLLYQRRMYARLVCKTNKSSEITSPQTKALGYTPWLLNVSTYRELKVSMKIWMKHRQV